MIINALVLNKLFYCSSVWANASGKNFQKFHLALNFVARIISGIGKCYHRLKTTAILWLPVKDTLSYRDSIMTFKCINGLARDCLAHNFLKRSDIHIQNLRSCNNLNIPKYRTTRGQCSFTYRAVNIWNSLD